MEKPATKAGQIRAVWPEIRAALDHGQSMKSIRTWLEEEADISVAITSLTLYISRIRRRESPVGSRIQPDFESNPAVPETRQSLTASTMVAQLLDDPLAQAIRVLSRPKMDIRKIHNDGDPEGGNLI